MKPSMTEAKSFDANTLIASWEAGIEAFTAMAETLSSDQWYTASPLPGWSVGDIVAHIVGIERDLLGDPLPSLDLDWSQYPHANDLFSRYTELGVITRRDAAPAEVCAELRKSVVQRRERLKSGSVDLAQIVRGPGGWELPLGVSLRMRCFDIWVHTLDIAQAVNAPGPTDNVAAAVAADQMRKGVARNLGKAINASGIRDITINFDITGPGEVFHRGLHVDANGWATWLESSPTAALTLSTTWLNFAALASGRDYAQRALVAVRGDQDLAGFVFERLNVAP